MKKASILVSLALALLFMPVTISLAGGSGGGTGGGTGGNSSDPLTLVSSTVTDGQTDVGLTPEVTMVFSKNVTDLSVKEANLACFKLEKKDGGEVAYEVLMADSQVEPDKKNDVVVKPSAELEAGTEYIVTISKALTSKSGTSLAEDIVISFTTAAGGETPVTTEAPAATEAPATAEAPETTEAPAAEAADSESAPSMMIYIVTAIAAIVLIAGYWMKKKRS